MTRSNDTRERRSVGRHIVAAAFVLVAGVLVGCGDDDSFNAGPAFDPGLAARLQARLDDARVQLHTLGSVAGVQTADGAVWLGASGSNAPDQKTALRPEDRFRVASITKMFTAALVMKLIEEGRLHLEDTLDSWYPSFPGAPQITIRHLLSHTSGVADYLSRVHLRRHYEPDAVIDIAAAAGLLSPPGTQFSYANTNYFLLARIIEKTLGSSYGATLHSRLLDPLRLTETFLAGYEEIPGGFVRGGLLVVEGHYQDVTDTIDPSLLWSAGGLVSTAADLLRWSRLLFGGHAVAKRSVAAMMTEQLEGSRYGLGLRLIQGSIGTRYGHHGRINGFSSTLFAVPSRGVAVVTLCNDWGACELIADDLCPVLE